MEKTGFSLTILMGLATCVIMASEGYAGGGMEWSSGFLCAVWGLLMLVRLMTLTSAAPEMTSAGTGRSPLARKILQDLHESSRLRKLEVLARSLNGSFFLFITLGSAFCVWQILCTLLPQSNGALQGFIAAVTGFYEDAGISGSWQTPLWFENGRRVLTFLCFAIMAFLLRSYTAQTSHVRPALLVLSGYLAAGWITFLGFTPDANALVVDPAFYGMGLQSRYMPPAATLFDTIMLETGITGLCLLVLCLAVPALFICLAFHRSRPDWVVLSAGTMGVLGLTTGLFFPLHPALGGFLFLCWMTVSLSWGASERANAGTAGLTGRTI